jgi:dihydrofolate reductase
MINLIVAFDEGNFIGKDNSLPWHLPKDLNNFKQMTTGNVVVMGRNTWESLPDKFRPLPNRINIIISKTYYDDMDKFMNSFGSPPSTNTFAVRDTNEAVIAYENMFRDKEFYIIGGGKVYEDFLSKDLVERMIVTHVKGNCEGDTKFPEINWNDWSSKELDRQTDFTITQYDKIN